MIPYKLELSDRTDRAGRCGHCHGRGHYRPTCPVLASERARSADQQRAATLLEQKALPVDGGPKLLDLLNDPAFGVWLAQRAECADIAWFCDCEEAMSGKSILDHARVIDAADDRTCYGEREQFVEAITAFLRERWTEREGGTP